MKRIPDKGSLLITWPFKYHEMGEEGGWEDEGDDDEEEEGEVDENEMDGLDWTWHSKDTFEPSWTWSWWILAPSDRLNFGATGKREKINHKNISNN